MHYVPRTRMYSTDVTMRLCKLTSYSGRIQLLIFQLTIHFGLLFSLLLSSHLLVFVLPIITYLRFYSSIFNLPSIVTCVCEWYKS